MEGNQTNALLPRRSRTLQRDNTLGAASFLESVQDLLIKLDMKPCMHQLEISNFFTKSCHHQLYQNYEQPPQTSQNLYFQSHFSLLKIGRIFPPKKFYVEYLTRRLTFIKEIHNFCKSDVDKI